MNRRQLIQKRRQQNESEESQQAGRTNLAVKDEHSEVFKRYSTLTGIPLDTLLDECLAEYIYCEIEPHVIEKQQAATA
jgi:hypothetical protein